MNETHFSPLPDPELEVRLTALVLGEAADFERAQLLEIIARSPEVARYYKRIQQLHESLVEIGTGELVAPGDSWKITSERRESLLNVLDGKTAAAEANKFTSVIRRSPPHARRYLLNRALLALATATCLLVATGWLFRGQRMATNSTKQVGLALRGNYQHSASDLSAGTDVMELSIEPASPPSLPRAIGAERYTDPGTESDFREMADESLDAIGKPMRGGEWSYRENLEESKNVARGYFFNESPDTSPSKVTEVPRLSLSLDDLSKRHDAAADREVLRQDKAQAAQLDGLWFDAKANGPTSAEGLKRDEDVAKRELFRRQKAREMNPQEKSAVDEPFSTFSLHVSDVSFKLALAAFSQQQWPDASKIRIEEFVNALDYHDPLPTTAQRVACRIEQAIHPTRVQRNVMRISLRTAAAGRSQQIPLRLTVLLDHSGSMERPDRRETARRAFEALAQHLGSEDQITLIAFASTPRLLAEQIAGNEAKKLIELMEAIPSEGGTNLEAALQLAMQKAKENQLDGAQNRIVLMTDGAVNLGNADPERLSDLVVAMRNSGIAFDAAGISAQDLNDHVLESLTRQGDGRYYLLDTHESADQGFAAEIAGALRPAAKNVKVQVDFNPQRVGLYRLLGYDNHRLNAEDFKNDKVDAAEMTAAEAGVAVYQFQVDPQGSGDVGTVAVRFLDVDSGRMVERRWPIPYEPNAMRLDQAAPELRLATVAAMTGAKLSGDDAADSLEFADLSNLLSSLPESFKQASGVQQLKFVIDRARALSER